MKRMITNTIMAAGILAVLIVGATDVSAAEFTWTAGLAPHNNQQLWGSSYGGNWQGGTAPVNNAGDTATITSFPSAAYGTRTIQLRDNITVGILNADPSTGNSVLNRQTTQTFTFDNNGGTAQINGGNNANVLQITAPVTVSDTTEMNVNGMSELRFNQGITGTSGVTITGNASDNDVYYRGGTFDYTGETRITSGTLRLHSGITSLGSANIVVNGTWDTTESTTTGYTLAPSQTLSGTGTVAMYAAVKAESRALKSNEATIVPGDGGVGTLTVSGAGLSLTGGTNVFEVGEASSDQISATRLYLSGTPGTVQIVDAGRTSTGTVTLFDRTPDSHSALLKTHLR